MKQRIKLAQALAHDPDLLFLDEPTNGMDPKGRDEMLELVRDLGHNKGVSLILSSHLLPDVEYTCDDVVVMDKGQIATQGPINELKGPAGRVFELRVKGDLGCSHRKAWTSTRPTKTSCGCSFRPDPAIRGPFLPRRRASARRSVTCARACRHSRMSSRKP
jgi:ABC-type multidrug transport system ATPase subunit